ncbi:MAG: discoidin domain-containing protein, partial [Planctomycetota bacterium]
SPTIAQEDVAPFGTASQTSTCFNDPAEFAIDGDINSFTHTCAGNNDLGPAVWEIDLGGDPDITRIVIQNRRSCCGSRLRDIYISLHNDPYLEDGIIVGDPIVEIDLETNEYEWEDAEWQSELLNPENELGVFPNGPAELAVDIPATVARYVRVTRIPDPDNSGAGEDANADEATVLQIAEIEIFGEGGFVCPEAGDPDFGDARCEDILVDPPIGGAEGDPGIYTVTVISDDDTGDALQYTITAHAEGGGDDIVIGPTANNIANFSLLFGSWSFSATVDDDLRCDDPNDEGTCDRSFTIDILADENLALGKPTWHSSQLGGFGPELAVDGNPGNFTHTLAGNNGAGPAMWEVDLVEIQEIQTIDIFNRTSCCGSRLRDIIVSIHDVSAQIDPEEEPIWQSELLNPENEGGAFPLGPGSLQVVLDPPVEGQFVRITRIPDDDNSGTGGQGNADEATVLSLGEVEVYGVPADCPAEGDTHCEELTVTPFGEIVDGTPGVYTASVIADDDSGDAISYLFTAEEAGGQTITIGPTEFPTADFNLVEGEWTISVRVDDDRCPDVADDATCTVDVSIECEGEADTHCELIEYEGPPGDAGGLYEFFAVAEDDSGDPVLYSWTADNGVDPAINIANGTNLAYFELGPGDWTISVVVDDDPACNDEAKDNTCTLNLTVGDLAENAAAGGIAQQSSQLGFFFPDLAINGDLNDFTHTIAGNDGLGPAIWEVNMNEVRNIAQVVLSNRRNCCGSRLRDVIVSIHDVSFLEDDPPVGNTAEDLPIWDSAIWESELLNPENELGTFPTGPGALLVDVLGEAGGPVEGQFLRVTRLPDDDNSGTEGQGNQDEATVLSLGEVLVYECEGDDCDDDPPPPPPGDNFLRGDPDASGAINITDGIFLLNFLFLGGPAPGCRDAGDADDSGAINITDGIFVLNFLFLGGPNPPGPYPDCGVDTTDDTTTCETSQPSCDA